MSSGSFTCFQELPTELRLQIWHDAFSAAHFAVLAITSKSILGDDHAALGHTHVLTYADTGPYRVGASCREARFVLQEYYISPITYTPTGATYLVPPEQTILHLGNCVELGMEIQDTRCALRSYARDPDAAVVSGFKHAVISWSTDFDEVKYSARWANKIVPSLRTLILHYGPTQVDGRAITLETAAKYIAIIENPPIPHREGEPPGTTIARSFLRITCKRSGNSVPKFYFLPDLELADLPPSMHSSAKWIKGPSSPAPQDTTMG